MKWIVFFMVSLSVLLTSCRQNAPADHAAAIFQKETLIPSGASFLYDDFHFLDSLYHKGAKPMWDNSAGLIDTFLRDTIESEIGGIDTLWSDRGVYAVRIYSRRVTYTAHCHGALCSVSFFRKENDGAYTFLRSSVIADSTQSTFGTFGNYADIQLINIGKGSYAYLVEPSYTGQGITLSSLFIFEITDSLEIKPVLEMQDASNDNSLMYDPKDPQGVLPYSYSSTLFFNALSSRHTDIGVHKKGTQRVDDKIINIDSTFIYTYHSDRYKLIQTIVNEKNTGSK